MNLFGHHIVILNDEQHAIAQAALSAAGHTVVAAGADALTALEAEVRAKYPEVIAGIQKGIADAKDPTVSGGQKAVNVAEDALATAPAVLAALPSAKDFFVSLVTKEFALLKTELVNGAKALVGAL